MWAPVNRSQRSNTNWYVVLFLIVLIFLIAAFVWMARTATSLLPQSDEIISLSETAQLVQNGQVERILIQEDRDLFLYLPARSRPLYSRLEPGTTVTETLESLGVDRADFPPIEVDED